VIGSLQPHESSSETIEAMTFQNTKVSFNLTRVRLKLGPTRLLWRHKSRFNLTRVRLKLSQAGPLFQLQCRFNLTRVRLKRLAVPVGTTEVMRLQPHESSSETVARSNRRDDYRLQPHESSSETWFDSTDRVFWVCFNLTRVRLKHTV